MKPAYWYWNPLFGEWQTILACGDLSIKEWYALLKRTGFCTARAKGAKK